MQEGPCQPPVGSGLGVLLWGLCSPRQDGGREAGVPSSRVPDKDKSQASWATLVWTEGVSAATMGWRQRAPPAQFARAPCPPAHCQSLVEWVGKGNTCDK